MDASVVEMDNQIRLVSLARDTRDQPEREPARKVTLDGDSHFFRRRSPGLALSSLDKMVLCGIVD